MKKILLPFFLLLLVFTANAQSKRNIYYYYKGEKVYYSVSTDRLIVGMNQTMAFAELKFIVANAIGISADSLQEIQDNKQFIIKFGKNKLIDEKPYVTKLLQLQWIQFARPVFLSESGNYNSYGTEFIVKLKPKTKYITVQKMMESNGCTLVRKYPFQNDMYILSADKKANYDALAMSNLYYESGLFDYAEPNKIVYEALSVAPPNDPFYNSQWAHNNNGAGQNNNPGGVIGVDMKVFQAWEISMGSPTIKVGVIDQGVDLTHPDLKANLLQGFNGGTMTSNPGDGAPTFAGGAHGTNCAGIIGAIANNGIGVAGVAPKCKIIPAVIFGGTNGVYLGDAAVAASFDYIRLAGADVISNSWGGGSVSSTIDAAINRAVTLGRGGKGCVVLFSSGNGDAGKVGYPASNSQVISVGGVNNCGVRKTKLTAACDGENWWGANYGPGLDVVAPCIRIVSTDNQGTGGYNTAAGTAGDYFTTFNGTSSACPNAAGVVALILSVNPNLTVDSATKILERSCVELPGYTYAYDASQPNSTWNNETGHGMVNALNALFLTSPNPLVIASYPEVIAGNCGGPSVIDPGEIITVNFGLSNFNGAPLNAGNVTAILQSSGGVTNPSAQQRYGFLLNDGSVVTRPFTFKVNGACGDTVTATLKVKSGAYYKAFTYKFLLGYTPINLFSENFDGVTAPALPSGWTTSQTGAIPPALFATTTISPNSSPNVAFTNGVTTVASNSLISPAISISAGVEKFLSFKHAYNFDGSFFNQFDGGVLEVSTNGSSFVEITSAAIGGTFIAGGYTGTISPNSPNPLRGRLAWGKLQTTYGSVIVKIPADFSGNVKFRWLAGWDHATSAANPNWRIDDISLYTIQLATCSSCPEIDITGNGVAIPKGESSPSTTDHTDFGTVCTSSNFTRTYTINNTGTANLSISSINVSGTNQALFTVGSLVPSGAITPGNSATFDVTFAPTTTGLKTATITVNNNDGDEASYDFAIQGTGDKVGITSITQTNTPLCGGTRTTMIANGVTGTNALVRWYDAPGGTGNVVGTGLSSDSVFAGTYYAYVTGDCGSPVDASFTIAGDVINPTISCPSNVSVNNTNTLNCTKSVVLTSPTFSDNCKVKALNWVLTGATNATSSLTGIKPITSRTFNNGTTTITYSVLDFSNLSTSCSFTVTVNDVVKPSFTTTPTNINTTITTGCSKIINVPNVSFSDNCGTPTLTWSTTGATIINGTGQVGTKTFNLGTTTLTYTLKDANNNVTTATILVKVIASITCPSNITTNTVGTSCTKNIANQAPNYVKTCSYKSLTWAMTGATVLSSPVNGIWLMNTKNFKAGLTTVRYTLTDLSGNTSACSYAVQLNTTNNCPIANQSRSIVANEVSASDLKAVLSPNPTSSSFALHVKSNSKSAVQITVYNSEGKRIQQLKTANLNNIMFGEKYSNGSYMIEVRQGKKRTTVIGVKQ